MVDPEGFDDPAASLPVGPSRARRAVMTVVVVLLVASMAFLAFVSGRGMIVPIERKVVPPSLPQANAAPTPVLNDPLTARLAVVDTNGRLSTIDQFGGSVTALGALGTRYSVPTWSPDGRHIAAIATDPDESASVQVFSVSGGAPDPTTGTVVYASQQSKPDYIFWTPDGRSVTFMTDERMGAALWVAPLDGGGTDMPIAHMGAPLYWSWLRDGEPLVHGGAQGGDPFLGEVGLWDRTRDAISTAPGGFRAPGTSADGRYRAFAVRQGDAYRIVVESMDGGVHREIPVKGTVALAFDPASDQLAYIAPTKPDPSKVQASQPVGPLQVLDPATGISQRVAAGSVVAFSWSPDGKTLAALQLPTDDDKQAIVPSVPTARLAAFRTTAIDHGGQPAAPTDPGVRLRLTFLRTDDWTLRSKSTVELGESFVSEVMPAFEQYGLSHRLWSPDSSALALPVVAADGTTSIVEIRPDGSQPRRIASGTAAFWSP
jgi:dipeptidyl aminopeptidase/acylaminoacyl peptidase